MCAAGGWLAAIRQGVRPFHSPETHDLHGLHHMDFLSPESVPPAEIEALLDLCFGPARQLRTAALLRRGAQPIPEAGYVAVDEGRLVGSIAAHRLNWVHPRRTRPIALIGPVVSHPERRGERIGMRLMDLALAEIDRLGLAACLIGDEPYYGRWGFSARHTGDWLLPGPVDRARLLLRAPEPRLFAGAARLEAAGDATEGESRAAS